ncbi:MAG: cyclic nucleotide-binding domain-containing protein [Verrucomicrobiales bacterium]
MSTPSASPGDSPNLAGVGLFAGFGDDVLRNMEARARRIVMAKGAVVFRAGDTSDEFFVLTSGRLEVSVNRSGRKVVLATLEPSAYFGEMAMLAAEPRSATVTATEDSVVIEMSRHLLMEFFRAHEGLMDQMVKNIANRKRANTPLLQEEPEMPKTGADDAPSERSLFERIKQMLHLGK